MSTEPQTTPINGSSNADTSQSSVTKNLDNNNNNDSNSTTKIPTQSENRKSQSGGDSTSMSASSSQTSQDAESKDLEDKVKLTLLLVSGKRHTFVFDPFDTITVVKSRVFNNWPKEWADETPVAVSSLKIVYQGRFLEDDTTLETNKILRGQTTIVHLAIKNVLQQDNDDPKYKDEAPKCHCIIL